MTLWLPKLSNHKRTHVQSVPTPLWDPQFHVRSPIFEPLHVIAASLSQSAWPSREELTDLASARAVTNASGFAITFGAPGTSERSAAYYERRIADTGVVEHRDSSWHDLFNALVWMTFRRSKAVLNRRHAAELHREISGRRSAARDALTQFDEDGMLVVSERADLLDLLRGFEWRELFWQRRTDVASSMRWLVFGHAQYEKALRPFVGLTAKALTVKVTPGFCSTPRADQIEHLDGIAAQIIAGPGGLSAPAVLAPVPVLGIPGWSTQSEHVSFYDNHSYFRPGRRCRAA